MKTFLIIILSAALATAAYATRPTQEDFERHLARATPPAGKSKAAPAATLPDGCTFANCYLWTEVRRDGQTVYVGAFSHWFSRWDLVR